MFKVKESLDGLVQKYEAQLVEKEFHLLVGALFH